MAITSLHAQDFAQDVQKAIAATENGPVFITDRGIPSHVLLSYLEYQRLLALKRSIASNLAMPGNADVEFEVPRANICLRPADFL
ncbi:type II toxin-antitoxin system Phd/YefM family antitoxin [Herbaspirillum sp. YR522]|uniref:type II toxin-antitoxin system Phd/YefM family antitoxin n=1 Tax=Herbaspirillum sp. YR522 TaxID=1144342 RepID=UPI0009D91764|nr:type II toxin-antitoxin system Phd/YefM family antitoxin [Herbaspirillum sp. YR522]